MVYSGEIFDLQGNLLGENPLYRTAITEATKARPMAIKSGREVRAGVVQVDYEGHVFSAFSGNMEDGTAGHADSLAKRFLYQQLPTYVPLSIDVLAFFDPKSENGYAPTLCGLCLEEFATVAKGIPIMKPDAVVIGAGTKSGIVVPWKSYMTEPWREAVLDIVLGDVSIGLDMDRAIYTMNPIAGEFLPCLGTYPITGLEFSSPERAMGPISLATDVFLDKVCMVPQGFIFVAEDMPKVNYIWRQMLYDRVGRMGADRASFPVYRMSINTRKLQVATLGELLPFAFKSLKS